MPRSIRRFVGWLSRSAVPHAEPLPAGPLALPSYVALGHWGARRASLEPRLQLLVAELSAELSACQWCIAQSRHRWLKAFLPPDLLRQLRAYETSSAFTERERAALALAEAVARHSDREAASTSALERARRYFAEAEVAGLAAAAAGEHFFDPATGTIGRDALTPSLSDMETTPWHAIDRGIAIRGLY